MVIIDQRTGNVVSCVGGLGEKTISRAFNRATQSIRQTGSAIKPIAVRMVYQVAQAVNIPVLGMGGIVNGEDAIEFMLAGASAVSIGAGNFIKPTTSIETIAGIEDYMRANNIADVKDIIGKVEMN